MDAAVIYTNALKSALIFGAEFAAIGFVIVVLTAFVIKMKAIGKWYIEVNRNGELLFELLQPDPDDGMFKPKCGGAYYPPEEPRMRNYYPPGIPKLLQVEVWHEKYVHGNPDPLYIPQLREDAGLAIMMRELSQASSSVMRSFHQNLSTIAGVDTKKAMIIVGVMVAVTILLSGVGTFLGYQLYEEQKQIVQAIGGL